MTAVGLDVGARWTKAAWRDAVGGGGGRELPTAVALDAAEPLVGQPALAEAAANPDAALHRSLLGALAPECPGGADPWRSARPVETLRALLAAVAAGIGGSPISGLALAVPEPWRDRPIPAGSAVLAAAVAAVGERARVRLVSQPVAAACALLRDRPEVMRLLLVDAGAAAIEVALLSVAAQGPCVQEFASSAEAGIGMQTRLAEAARERIHGHGGGAGEAQLIRLLHELEAQEETARAEVRMLFEAARDDHDFGDAPAFAFAARGPFPGAELSLDDLRAAVAPIGAAITGLVREVLRTTPPSQDVSVAVIGGLAFLPPVTAAVRAAVDGGCAVLALSEHEQRTAVASGALLIAEGAADPVPRYPHELAAVIGAHRGGLRRNETVTLAPAGALEIGGFTPRVVPDPATGWPLTVRLEEGRARRLAVEVRRAGSPGTTLAAAPLNAPTGRYEAGVQVDRDMHGYLVLSPVDANGAPLAVCALGQLPYETERSTRSASLIGEESR